MSDIPIHDLNTHGGPAGDVPRGPDDPLNPSGAHGASGHGQDGDGRGDDLPGGGVAGERRVPAVHRERSLQSRLTGLLAGGLVVLLGAGSLVWWYTSAIARQARAREAAHERSIAPARGEMALPPLRVPAGEDAPPPAAASGRRPPDPPAQAGLPLASTLGISQAMGTGMKSAAEITQARQLSGGVFARQSGGTSPGGSGGPPGYDAAGTPGAGGGMPAADASAAALAALAAAQDRGGAGEGARARDPLATLLTATVTPAVQARVLPTQRFLLPKGAFIDCTLETAIDSTLPGLTSCVTADDTFGADGKVVLLERGTRLTGETRGQVSQGMARVFVLWTEARTPAGVVVPLDSPGADELGRSGLPGRVNRHFADRFGAAILLSLLDGGVQAAVQAENRGGGTVLYGPQETQSVLAETLKSTIGIPPSVQTPNGARIQVLVARDVDFRSVYALRTAHE